MILPCGPPHDGQESRLAHGNTKVGRLPLRECLICSISILAFFEVLLEILLRSKSHRILVEPPSEAYLLISTPVLKSSSAGTRSLIHRIGVCPLGSSGI